MTAVGTEHFDRAGFWRRFFAFFVDAALILLFLQAIGALSYSLTDGVIQSSASAIISATECRKLSRLPPGLVIPEQFKVNAAITRTSSFFGFPNSSVAKVGWIEKQGNLTTSIFETVTLDAAGNYRRTFDLGWLSLPLFLGLRIWRESAGKRSPGRRWAKVRLVALDGSQLGVVRLMKRYGVALAPIAPGFLASLAEEFAQPFFVWKFIGLDAILWATAAFALPVVVMGLWAVIDVVRRRDTYYDRSAGTSVVFEPK